MINESNFIIAIVTDIAFATAIVIGAEFYESAIHKSNFIIAIVTAIVFATAIAIGKEFYESMIHESNFIIAIVTAIAFTTAIGTEFYESTIHKSNFIIAIVPDIAFAYAIAFVIPLQSETALSSLIHSDDLIIEVQAVVNAQYHQKSKFKLSRTNNIIVFTLMIQSLKF